MGLSAYYVNRDDPDHATAITPVMTRATKKKEKSVYLLADWITPILSIIWAQSTTIIPRSSFSSWLLLDRLEALVPIPACGQACTHMCNGLLIPVGDS